MNEPSHVVAWAAEAQQDVCICGVGARTPVGLDVMSTAAAVRGSISGLGIHPHFVDLEDEPVSFASDPALTPDVPVAQRMLQMLRSVVDEVAGPLEQSIELDAVWLALPEARAGLAPDLASWLIEQCATVDRINGAAIHALPRGHAGGLMALQAAALALSRGESSAALVIGVDSYHDTRTIASLDLHRRLMSARNRGGFPPGEAAGVCLLMRGDAAQQLNLPLLARVCAAATALESRPLRSNEPCLGEGLTAAIASSLRSLDLPRELITTSYCDLNGERYRNEEFVYALLRTQEAFVNAHDYISPADCWGDVGAASGPLFATLAICADLRGYSKGTRPLLWASSDHGFRSAVTLVLGPH